jgi:uncharacterized protein YjiS (DUF1127 family)
MIDLLIATDRRYAAYFEHVHRLRARAIRRAFRRLLRLPGRAWAAFRARRRRHKLVGELRALDDRTLADIGLRRANILSAVYEGEGRDVPADGEAAPSAQGPAAPSRRPHRSAHRGALPHKPGGRRPAFARTGASPAAIARYTRPPSPPREAGTR